MDRLAQDRDRRFRGRGHGAGRPLPRTGVPHAMGPLRALVPPVLACSRPLLPKVVRARHARRRRLRTTGALRMLPLMLIQELQLFGRDPRPVLRMLLDDRLAAGARRMRPALCARMGRPGGSQGTRSSAPPLSHGLSRARRSLGMPLRPAGPGLLRPVRGPASRARRSVVLLPPSQRIGTARTIGTERPRRRDVRSLRVLGLCGSACGALAWLHTKIEIMSWGPRDTGPVIRTGVDRCSGMKS